MDDLSDFEAELLFALAELQRDYESGDWDFGGTLWSRVSFRMARARSADRPSPIPGKRNLTDAFRSRFGRAVTRLISAGYVRKKRIRGGEPQARYTLGYHNHKARNRDIFLTEKGQDWVTARRPAPPEAAPEFPSEFPSEGPAEEPGATNYEYVSVPTPPRPKPEKPKRVYSYSVVLPR